MLHITQAPDEAIKEVTAQARKLLASSKEVLKEVEGNMSEGVVELRRAFKDLHQALERGLTDRGELQGLLTALQSKQGNVTNMNADAKVVDV